MKQYSTGTRSVIATVMEKDHFQMEWLLKKTGMSLLLILFCENLFEIDIAIQSIVDQVPMQYSMNTDCF